MKVRGTCFALFVYDTGWAIDLDLAEHCVVSAERRTIFKDKRRAPALDHDRPMQLRLTQTGAPYALKGFTTEPRVELSVYASGAVCLTYAIALDCALPDLIRLSDELYANAALLDDSRRRMQDLSAVLKNAIDKPLLSETVEDYVIFALEPPDGADISALLANHATTLAQILRAELNPLSCEEVNDALSQRVSYRPGEVCQVDWFAAFLIGIDLYDERMVLELATVELLELRLLDAQLDRNIEEAYSVASAKYGVIGSWPTLRSGLRRIAQMQAESALLFEGVDNAHKLLGDQYLARLYRVASTRFHLSDWDAAIERKLQMLDSIYEKTVGRADAMRDGALEWIIIILIASEIVFNLVAELH